MISMDKKYVCRNGTPVTILSTSLNMPNGRNVAFVVHLGVGDSVLVCDSEGRFINSAQESCYDIIEVSPYADFSIDEKVMVSNDGNKWRKRYFAEISPDGKAVTFKDGATSWSKSNGDWATFAWKFCRRPTPEEIGE